MRYPVARILIALAVAVVAGWHLSSGATASLPLAAVQVHVIHGAHDGSLRVLLANPNPFSVQVRRIDVVDSGTVGCAANSVEIHLTGLPRVLPGGGAATLAAPAKFVQVAPAASRCQGRPLHLSVYAEQSRA